MNLQKVRAKQFQLDLDLNQVYGSKDPDPYQNVTDPERCYTL